MKSFLIYALRRIFLLIPFLIGLTILAFLLGVLAPGDPAMAVLIMDGTAEPTESELLAMRESMGLDQPFWMQYGSWLTQAVVGDLGVSYLTHRPVLSELMRRFPVTLHLALWAMGWVILLGIPAGIWAARRKGHAAEIGLEIVALFYAVFLAGDHDDADLFGRVAAPAFLRIWRCAPHDIAILCAGSRDSGCGAASGADVGPFGDGEALSSDRAGEGALCFVYRDLSCPAQFADAGHYHAGHVFCLNLGRLGHY